MKSMTPQELYEIWAPPGSLWSPWAKPVAFAQMHMGKRPKNDPVAGTEVTFEPLASFEWASSYREDTAIVLDLPDVTTIETAMQLAVLGYRPVPMYNCANSEAITLVVPVEPIISALSQNAPLLGTFTIRPDAPPAFMLDANRNAGLAPKPLDFDNRWVVFPQDFPSATFLQAHGIKRVLILQPKRKSIMGAMAAELQSDLYEVARRWHNGGLEVLIRQTVEAQASSAWSAAAQPQLTAEQWMTYETSHQPLTFGPLSRFRLGAAGFVSTLFALAMRRSSGGGFGQIIPEPSSSGGG
jgi:hypothetical protein